MEPLSYGALIIFLYQIIKFAELLSVLLFYMHVCTFQVFTANPITFLCILKFWKFVYLI